MTSTNTSSSPGFPQDTVTAYVAAEQDPKEIKIDTAYKRVLKDGLGILNDLPKSYIRSHTWDDLAAIDDPAWFQNIAAKGRFPYQPSKLFLKCFAAALATMHDEPSVGVVSPSLVGASGVLPLTVVSVIPDIMQHYHDVIAAAKFEVLLATNAWEPGRSVELVTSALRKLNERAAKDGQKVVVKLLMDAASIRNALQPRYFREASTWEKMGLPTQEEMSHLDLQVMNYHIPPLGTFHVKMMVVDRQVALINSNNVNIRSNVEMMCRIEGDIVDAVYDTFLISWSKAMPIPPGLPCLHQPADANREFRFGAGNLTGSSTLSTSPEQKSTFKGEWRGQFEHTQNQNDPKPGVAAVNKRLNVFKDAEPSPEIDDESCSNFSPFYFHAEHRPVPMALVNRRPYQIPGHQDLDTPQNAAWIAGLKLAQKEVFIQSPVFCAKPAMEAVIEACKRGIKVTLFVDVGFNDFAEGTVPFQGGTNEKVCQKMHEDLAACGKEEFLEYYWYTAKDQDNPIRFETNQRNCHVKFMQIDGQVGIMGSGNMDTQSWFHSSEVNVMVDSPAIVKEWMEIFAVNQNTGKFGRIDKDLKLVSGKDMPKKSGHGGLSRAQGGFL